MKIKVIEDGKVTEREMTAEEVADIFVDEEEGGA